MNTDMTVSCVEFEEDNYDLQLHYGEELIACVEAAYNEDSDFLTHCILQKPVSGAPILSGMHVTSIVLSTIMSLWSVEHESIRDVFIDKVVGNRRPIIVNPALYRI